MENDATPPNDATPTGWATPDPAAVPSSIGVWQAPAVIAAFLLIVGVAAGAGIALGASSDDGVAAAPTPVVGTCHTYDGDAAEAPTNESPAVDCAGQHSAQVFAVTDALPEATDTGWTARQVERAAAPLCNKETAATWLGISDERMQTMRLGVFFYIPSVEQAKEGARWIRCDVGLIDRGQLSTVAGDFRTLVETPGVFTQCVYANGLSRTAVRCTNNANLLASVGIVDLGEYTGAPVDKARIDSECARQAAAVSTSADPRTETLLPNVLAWRAGRDFADCFMDASQWTIDTDDLPAETRLGAPTTTSV